MTAAPTVELASIRDTGSLGIPHLKRYWSKCMAKSLGHLPQHAFQEEWSLDQTLLAATGLGLEQVTIYLFHTKPTFDAFEQWVLAVNGGHLEPGKIAAYTALFTGTAPDESGQEAPVLSAEDLAFFEENGYIIVREAISPEDCRKTVDVVCDFIQVSLDDPASWYTPNPARQGIMVQLFQHSQLDRNRHSDRIRRAYAQLWGRKDIWVNSDRVGFNPPETETYHFPGPRLHWDVSVAQPIPFGLQGILYLSDTQENQGAFTLVPGFHKRIGAWLESLPAGAHPREQDLYALGTKPIGANAGDLIIWHHALPHGSSPNTSSIPRIVQYLNYAPVNAEVHPVWI